eukprot:667166_1
MRCEVNVIRSLFISFLLGSCQTPAFAAPNPSLFVLPSSTSALLCIFLQCTLLHRFLLLLGVIPFINHLSLSIRYSLCTLFCSSYFNLKIANLRWYRLFHHALIL